MDFYFILCSFSFSYFRDYDNYSPHKWEKTLKYIVLDFSSQDGPNKSFRKDTFFDDFTALVHPELRNWFLDYVEGTVPLDIAEGVSVIGVEYSLKEKHDSPKDILSDYGSKGNRILFGKYKKVKKVGKKDPVGFKVGDKIDKEKNQEEFYDVNGYPVEEGTHVRLYVKRDDFEVELPYTMQLKNRKYKHLLRILSEMNENQSQNCSNWIGE